MRSPLQMAEPHWQTDAKRASIQRGSPWYRLIFFPPPAALRLGAPSGKAGDGFLAVLTTGLTEHGESKNARPISGPGITACGTSRVTARHFPCGPVRPFHQSMDYELA